MLIAAIVEWMLSHETLNDAFYLKLTIYVITLQLCINIMPINGQISSDAPMKRSLYENTHEHLGIC